MRKPKVVIGLSGGVDSSVSAFLLKEQGYDVIAIFMRNWNDDSVILHDECPWIEDSADALLVAEKLDIPFQVIDFSEVYKNRIVDYMFAEYEAGRTPNPDVLCNREIKFDVFMETAMRLGADFVATGHYCQKGEIKKGEKTFYRLLAGKDKNKDQSYFLCQLNQEQLSQALFPIGHLTKPEVRRIAKEQELVTAGKKDSQGLCFIGKVRLPDFLQQKLSTKTGDIIEIPSNFNKYHKPTPNFDSDYSRLTHKAKNITYQKTDGHIVGKHQGAHFFTKGQRKGLAVGGTKEPLFVIETNVEDNIIYTGQGKAHSGLYKFALRVKKEEFHWVRPDLELKSNESIIVLARIRYRQELQSAKLYVYEDNVFVEFEQAQSAITEGQFVALYLQEELIASGVIS